MIIYISLLMPFKTKILNIQAIIVEVFLMILAALMIPLYAQVSSDLA